MLTWEEIQAILAKIGTDQPPTDAELADALAALKQLKDANVEGFDAKGGPDDEDLAGLEAIADSVAKVTAEQSKRETEAADRQAKAKDLADKIDAAFTEPEGGDDGETGDEGDGDAEEGDGETEPEGKVAVAASSKALVPPRITKVAARGLPAKPTPKAVEGTRTALIAAASGNGVNVGDDLTHRPADLAQLFVDQWKASQGYRGPKVTVPVVRVTTTAPEERTLSRDPFVSRKRIEDVTSHQAIAAAGGICSPFPVRYDLPYLAPSEDRPVTNEMLTRFAADRGGVKVLSPAIITDIPANYVTVWTETNDTTPSNPATKGCVTIECPGEDSAVVDALFRCFQFGNFNQRFFPELHEEMLALAGGMFARFAENRWLTAIGSGSTQVTAGTNELTGTTRNVLAAVNLAATAFRNRHRLPDTFPFRVGFPSWLYRNMQADLARQMPVGTMDETLAVAAADIARWFSVHNLNVTWFMDGETGQTFGPQGDGLLNPWPDTVVGYLFPEGTWLHLDGGTLDFGIVRDSTLIATNDFKIAVETFEAIMFHGVESLRLNIEICASGQAAALKDTSTLCTSGS